MGARSMRTIAFIIALLCHTTPSLAEAWPDWVKVTNLPKSERAENDFVRNGVHLMLIDRQIRLHATGQDYFTRRVMRVVQRPGLEDVGAISIDFDPVEEELIIHDVWRVRNGIRTRIENLKFQTIRRENEIDYGILDGRLTRYSNIEDLRVGDTIDLSWTRRVRPTVFPEHFLHWMTEHPTSSFQIQNTRILTPDSLAITINGPAVPKVTHVGEMMEYEWRHENTPPPDFDYETQEWEEVFGETQVASTSAWADVIGRVQEAYKPQPLPENLAARVRKFEGTEAEKVTAAFRLVQDEIRYMGIEIGPGGYIPRPPDLVWIRRFGDCKDKALLLVSMLAEIGIDADGALVSSYRGEKLEGYHPSPYLFDHAIVRVKGEQGDYFLDPTDVLQGGVGNDIVTRDFVWALPLREGVSALEPVPGRKLKSPDYEVVSRYEFHDEGDLAADLFVTTIYRADTADRRRYEISSSGLQDRADSYFEWYEDRYPGAQIVTPLMVEDDMNANTIVFREHYSLTDEGLKSKKDKFWLNPYATKNELAELPDADLETPYELEPRFHRHRVEIVGLDGSVTPPDYALQTRHFRFSRDGEDIDGGFAAEYELEVLADAVLPPEAEAYREARSDKRKKQDWRINLSFSKRLMSKPLLLGMSTRTTILFGACLFALSLVMIAGAIGYRRERTHQP